MRKSTLFISAALTTMMLVMLVGAVSAYQTITRSVNKVEANPQPVSQAQPVSNVVEQQAVVIPTIPPTPALLTAEQAAQVAAQAISRTDLYSVETTIWNGNGLQAYLVTFSSGDLVYVSPEGQILEITKIPTTFITAPNKHKSSGGNNTAGGNNSDGEAEHEGGDD